MKTFVPQLIAFTARLCVYYSKHQAKILAWLQPRLSASDFSTVSAAMAGLQVACAILERIAMPTRD